MEKPNINISLATSLQATKAAFARGIDPDVMWRFVVGTFICGAVAIGMFAYLTYLWAMNIETATTPVKRDQVEFSLEELRGVIRVYEEKEATYNTLLQTRPVAPEYAKGKGLTVAPSVLETTAPIELNAELGDMESSQGTATPAIVP